jgi:hypothetical protein
LPEWLQVAIAPSTVARGLKFAFVVGAVLIAINHGDALLRGEIDGPRALKMGLTVTVPYLVSTFSTVGATLQLRGRREDRGEGT